MGATLNDLPLIDDNDLIGIANCAQAVCDDKTCPPVQQFLQSSLDQALSSSIQAVRNLIQDKDLRIGKLLICEESAETFELVLDSPLFHRRFPL